MLDPGGHLHAINDGKGSLFRWNGLRQGAAKQQTGSEQKTLGVILHQTIFRKRNEGDSSRLPDLLVFGQPSWRKPLLKLGIFLRRSERNIDLKYKYVVKFFPFDQPFFLDISS
jgi:hypothetical protein